MSHKKPRQLTRLLQVTIPRDAYILLGKLIQRRVEHDFAPSKATKSSVMAEAITSLAVKEGLVKEAPPEKEKVPKGAPFELVPAGSPASLSDHDHDHDLDLDHDGTGTEG